MKGNCNFDAILQKIRRHSEVRRSQPQGLRGVDALRHRQLDADGGAEGHPVPASLVALVHRDFGIRRDPERAHCIFAPRLLCDRFSAQSEIIGVTVKNWSCFCSRLWGKGIS